MLRNDRRRLLFFIFVTFFLIIPVCVSLLSCASSPPPIPVKLFLEESPEPVKQEPELREILKEHVIFYDDFSDSRGEWKTNQESILTQHIQKDYFVLENSHGYNAAFTGVSTNITDTDFYIVESSIEKIKGKGECSYGISWGMDRDSLSSYFLLIFENYILYGKQEKGVWATIINWQQYSFINKGIPANKIAIKKHDDTLEVFVNEEIVYKAKAYNIFGDTIGFVLFGNITVKAEFMKITRLESILSPDENSPENELIILPEHEYLFNKEE